MLKFNEHRPEQRSAEANAAQSWIDRCRKKQEKIKQRTQEEARFTVRQQMITGLKKQTT